MYNPIHLYTDTEKDYVMFQDYVRSVTDRGTYNSVSFLANSNNRGPTSAKQTVYKNAYPAGFFLRDYSYPIALFARFCTFFLYIYIYTFFWLKICTPKPTENAVTKLVFSLPVKGRTVYPAHSCIIPTSQKT